MLVRLKRTSGAGLTACFVFLLKTHHAHVLPNVSQLTWKDYGELMHFVTLEKVVYITTAYHSPLCNMSVPSDLSRC